MSNEIASNSHEARTIRTKLCSSVARRNVSGIWRTYDGADGLPAGLSRLLQDRQGYLWLTSIHSLYRYDGISFTNYTAKYGLADSQFQSICEDRQGRLWFATFSDGVFCYDGARFINYTTEHGLAANRVQSICEDSQGRLWFGTANGISCYDGEHFVNYTTKNGLVKDYITLVCEDSQGRMWFGIGGRGISCFDGERFTNYSIEDGLAGNSVTDICADNQGRLWFGTYEARFSENPGEGGVSCYDGERFINYTTENGLPHNDIHSIYRDNQGRLWFGTSGGGVCCFDGKSFTAYTTADGLLDNRVTDIIQDQEGVFWFAHPNSGLTRFDEKTSQLLTDATAFESLIQTDDGSLWFGSDSQLCNLHNGQQRCKDFISNVLSLMVDSSGRFWVGTEHHGIYCYESTDAVWEGKCKHFPAEDSLLYVNSIIETRDGTILAGSAGPIGAWDNANGGLCRFDGNRFEIVQTPHYLIQRLMEDSNGYIWMGGWSGGGLSCYILDKDHKASLKQNYMFEHGVTRSDSVLSILEDNDNRLWIGTVNGLYCFDGKEFVPYGKEISDYGFYQISAKDSNGYLWFGTLGDGIYRYDGRHFQQLTKEDGLPGNSVTGFIPQQDGSMIIGTFNGIVRYRPTATISPGIEIQEVVADQIYPQPDVLELTTTQSSLITIVYHGLSLSTHKMRYSYILEGCDKEWQDTWESQVYYEKLPPGEYTFRVIAINRDLVTSKAPATLKLTVVPDPRDEHITQLESDLENRDRELEQAQDTLEHFSKQEASRWGIEGFVGKSKTIETILNEVRMLQNAGTTSVLITGESGTGKELIARAIHFGSERSKGPFITVNCSAIPHELAESILFGHVRGSFTGANTDRKGCFELANGGNLFLDEVGEMPIELQPKLLRVLDNGYFTPVGGAREKHVDVRIIAATNANLQTRIVEGQFRDDLYFRLARFTINVPPLREHKEDIQLLVDHFLRMFATEKVIENPSISREALSILEAYHYPGNVREMKNIIEHALILSGRSAIKPEHLRFLQFNTPPMMESPVSVDTTLETYQPQTDFDSVQRFIDECCVISPDAEVHKPQLLVQYQRFCQMNKYRPMTRNKFYGQILQLCPQVESILIGEKRLAGFKGLMIK
jgi:DNA-binding NtrC family response regulator/sugar lactone lactonase YvrE